VGSGLAPFFRPESFYALQPIPESWKSACRQMNRPRNVRQSRSRPSSGRLFDARGPLQGFHQPVPVLFGASEADKHWYEHLYILDGDYFSADGNQLVFSELARHLL
jgi:hypothetical protein